MDMEFEYLTGQLNPTQPALLAAFRKESAVVVQHHRPELDVRYGDHPRQRFDLFLPADTTPSVVMCYYHAGYWQSRDKADFRFLAPPFLAAGWAVALVNYPLCPDVSMDALLEAVQPSAGAVVSHLVKVHGYAVRPVLVGHSAGAQIAVTLAARHPDAAGVVGLSGVYDLLPLLETSLNQNLRMDRVAAARFSVLNRPGPSMPPAAFAVGARETSAFVSQTEAMDEAWRAQGNRSTCLVTEGADHFSLLRVFCDPTTPLHEAVIGLA